MILLAVAENAMVAGVREGAGAVEVVRVLDCGDRDLSINSTMDCSYQWVSKWLLCIYIRVHSPWCLELLYIGFPHRSQGS